MPIGLNVLGAAYARTDADISFDPVLRIENATLDMDTLAFRYIRTFEMLGKTARFEVIQGWQDGTWTGLLDGAPASVSRTGWTDTNLRIAVNLVGGPPLKGKEFAAYRAKQDVETLIGAALSVQLPTGHYEDGKLLNLGSNRFTFRPQVGVVHNRGNWSFESSASVWFFTKNDSFFRGTTREQDPLYTVQGSVVYSFSEGPWVSAGLAYGNGGESKVDGVSKDDRRENLLYSVSGGVPINRRVSLKAAYVGSRSQTSLGADTDTVSIGFSTRW